jgi:hypothetical protein
MKPDLHFQVIDHGDGLVAFVKIVPVRVPVDHAEASCCFVKFKGVASVLRKRRFLNSDRWLLEQE